MNPRRATDRAAAKAVSCASLGNLQAQDVAAALDGDLDRLFRRGAGPRHGRDIRVELFVPLTTIASGGEETVSLAREAQCADCKGSGASPGTQPRACEKCGGSGRLTQSQKRGTVSIQQITSCPDCRGTGSFIDKPCPACGGRGTTYREETLSVRIPVGAEEGLALRIPGRGEPSPEPGGQPGDAFVMLRSEADPRFERHGANLWQRAPLALVDAVLGTRITVPTLDGTLEVDVPAGTQPDSVLRLKGKGLPHFGSAAKGDLFLRIAVHVPEHLSARERELYEELRGSATPAVTEGWTR